MDKPLKWMGVLSMATALLALALSSLALLFGVGMDSATDYIRAIRKHERLNEDWAMLHRLEEVRQSILSHLIEGKLSLWEAATVLRDEDESQPERLRLPSYRHWLHLNREERYMHLLVFQAEGRLQSDPRRDKILKRLRAELQAYQEARVGAVSVDASVRTVWL